MIPKNKIEEAAELYTGVSLRLLVPEAEITNTAKDLYNYSISDFTNGVKFAEKELENLAIKFLDSIRDYERENGQRICFDERNSKELFEIFKQENYESNK